jgi:hypothetical protein
MLRDIGWEYLDRTQTTGADIIVLITVDLKSRYRLAANVIIPSVGCESKDIPRREVFKECRIPKSRCKSLPYALVDGRRLKTIAESE